MHRGYHRCNYSVALGKGDMTMSGEKSDSHIEVQVILDVQGPFTGSGLADLIARLQEIRVGIAAPVMSKLRILQEYPRP
jgi:hypothetical protein